MDGYSGSFNTLYLTDQTAASANGLAASVNAVRPKRTGHSVFVECGLSDAAATVVVTVILHSKADGTGAIGVAPPGSQTATGGSFRDTTNAGNYHAPILVFAGCEAPYYEVRIAATSAGNVDVKTWSA